MSRETPKAAISRRDFVKAGATAGLGATALAGFVKGDVAGQSLPQDWDMTADIVRPSSGWLRTASIS